MANKLSKNDALNKLAEVEDLLPQLTGLRKALEVAVSQESNMAAIDREHKEALAALLTEKEKLKKVKTQLAGCEGELQARIDADNVTFKALRIKHKEEMQVLNEKYAETEKQLKAEYETNKKKYNTKIKEKEQVNQILETKTATLENANNEARRIALAR